jgi:hypothetical protein
MPKKTIRLAQKSHSIPVCFLDFYADISDLLGVELVGTGKFMRRKKPEYVPKYNIQYYDARTGFIKVIARDDGFLMDLYVKVDPNLRHHIERYIRNYDN